MSVFRDTWHAHIECWDVHARFLFGFLDFQNVFFHGRSICSHVSKWISRSFPHSSSPLTHPFFEYSWPVWGGCIPDGMARGDGFACRVWHRLCYLVSDLAVAPPYSAATVTVPTPTRFQSRMSSSLPSQSFTPSHDPVPPTPQFSVSSWSAPLPLPPR